MLAAEHKRPIRFGLFDSGVGGLSVLRRLHQLASVCTERQFEFVYLGDTARCPYGNRSADEIQEFVAEIIAFLYGRGVDHVVMACNTSAAFSLDHARKISPVPVHDIISPTAKYAAANFRKIGVMATQGTANSHAFANKIQYHAPNAVVTELGCPKLVPLVEAGEVYSEHTKSVLIEYTNQLEEQEVEAVILGCTHFPFLRKAIRELLPEHIAIIDPADLLARQLIFDLGLKVPVEQVEEPVPEIHCQHAGLFYTTGSADAFAQTAAVCLGRSEKSLVAPGDVYGVSLDQLRTPNAKCVGDDRLQNVVQLAPVKTNLDSKIVAP